MCKKNGCTCANTSVYISFQGLCPSSVSSTDSLAFCPSLSYQLKMLSTSLFTRPLQWQLVKKELSGMLFFSAALLFLSSEETTGNPREILSSQKNILLPSKDPWSRQLNITVGISELGKSKRESSFVGSRVRTSLFETLRTTVDKTQLA